jgi:hypothetical protein
MVSTLAGALAPPSSSVMPKDELGILAKQDSGYVAQLPEGFAHGVEKKITGISLQGLRVLKIHHLIQPNLYLSNFHQKEDLYNHLIFRLFLTFHLMINN